MKKRTVHRREYEYDLIQDGVVVASVSSADRDAAWRDIQHYAAKYVQDGEVVIVSKNPWSEIGYEK